MMLCQPRRQVWHGDIRLSFYPGDEGIPAKAKFAAATGPPSSGGLDRAGSIQPLLEPNRRGG